MMLKSFIISFLLLIGRISCQTWPTFHFYSRASPNLGIQVTSATLTSAPGYNPTKDLKVVIHGYNSEQFSSTVTRIRDALLAGTDANVVMVDWKQGALSPNYFQAAPNTRIVGARTAEFLQNTGIDYKKIHCIGHSLGAHSCGFTGKNFKLGRITGSDPAGPLFAGNAPVNRLAVGDADYVDCIHSDYTLGIQEAICDKNFFPNGGKFQVGCPTIGRRSADLDMSQYEDRIDEYKLDTMVYRIKLSPDAEEESLTGCSHNRATMYYAESITPSCAFIRFTSTPCDSYANYQSGLCQCNQNCPLMGYCSYLSSEFGNFYLDTNPSTPFSKY